MATFSDGVAHGEDNMLDDIDPLASAGSLRQHLQELIDSKEKQLEQAATLGKRVLEQRKDLEQRIKELQAIDSDKNEHDQVSADMRLRYRELANTVEAWDEENVDLSSGFGSKVCLILEKLR